jgi:hypothetical protein
MLWASYNEALNYYSVVRISYRTIAMSIGVLETIPALNFWHVTHPQQSHCHHSYVCCVTHTPDP